MAIHSRILAWRIPWTEEPGGLLSTGSQSLKRLSTQAVHMVQTLFGSTHTTHLYLCLPSCFTCV